MRLIHKINFVNSNLLQETWLLLVLLLFPLGSLATANVIFQTQSYEYTFDFVRVFYDKKGKNAVLSKDADENGIPDQVEDIALQVWVTHQVFCKVYYFPDPFKSPRYRHLKFIEVSVLHPDYLKGSNGLAFDELMDTRGQSDKKGEKAIRINISKNINPVSNLTPSHETFHLIQNGVTYFKNRWFTEGMARWSEGMLGSEKIGENKKTYAGFLQNEKTNTQKLFELSYTATRFFWNIVAKLDKKRISIKDSKIGNQLKLKCYKNGKLVLVNDDLMGAGIMREVLLALDSQDDIVFTTLNYQQWTEKNQQSKNNNDFIFQAIKNSVKKYLYKG